MLQSIRRESVFKTKNDEAHRLCMKKEALRATLEFVGTAKSFCLYSES